jgi:hypothetical protein
MGSPAPGATATRYPVIVYPNIVKFSVSFARPTAIDFAIYFNFNGIAFNRNTTHLKYVHLFEIFRRLNGVPGEPVPGTYPVIV